MIARIARIENLLGPNSDNVGNPGDFGNSQSLPATINLQ